MQPDEQPVNGVSKKSKLVRIRQISALLSTAVLLFMAGWLVGSDRIGLNTAGDLASKIAESDREDLSVDGLQEIYDTLRKNYDGDVEAAKLLNGLKKGAVAAVGDTYTEYLTAEELEDFNSDLNGTFEGIGAELGREGDFIIIISPIKGAPAEKAGIQPQDVIIEIDGEPATGITVNEAVKKIRGEKGTEVKLTIIRAGEQKVIPITRDTIDIPSVEWSKAEGVGTIIISRFGDDTTELTERAAREFADAGIKKVVLDMRGNPGGLLDQAVGVANIWLPKGTTVLEEKRGGETIKTFQAPRAPIFNDDVKTVVLINKGSASASEIVAGALKDNGAATLLGETSYGKGSVQQLIDLRSGGGLKVTIARWFTPKGKNIDKEGIEPDISLARTATDIEANRDPQLERAKKELN